ncbi:hypothetical protein [Methanobacterium aggregans]|uniref:hypothetical protein n=1 Tax=Methanobacterium aggregans TaxID=1615586 RepID=UPI001AE82848|nr:hypothetical protein [Methanobacterium aggregans]MBP2045633.1 3-methyladenine DNA glycosylase/8-oxoguanine DNA glycosylase [Methanobacterium aggregans]
MESGDLNLEKFKAYESTDKIINDLCKIGGIGLWTAEFVLIRALNRFEAFPGDDMGIRRIISQFYCDGRRISPEEARENR